MKNIGNFWRLPFEICPATPLNSEGGIGHHRGLPFKICATSSDSEGGPKQHGEKVESKAQKEK